MLLSSFAYFTRKNATGIFRTNKKNNQQQQKDEMHFRIMNECNRLAFLYILHIHVTFFYIFLYVRLMWSKEKLKHALALYREYVGNVRRVCVLVCPCAAVQPVAQNTRFEVSTLLLKPQKKRAKKKNMKKEHDNNKRKITYSIR